ncbi:MAG: FecR domain-containing protein, partial [Pseudomonadota bacterium]
MLRIPSSFRPSAFAVAAMLILTPTALAQEFETAGVVIEVRDSGLQKIGGSSTWLSTGDAVIRNAALETDRLGELAVDMDDGSRLTLSPNSEIVIDRFVYDPDARDGAAVLTLARGTLRMITGHMPSERYQVQTTAISIGVRGTDFSAKVLDPSRVFVIVNRGAVAVTSRTSSAEFI